MASSDGDPFGRGAGEPEEGEGDGEGSRGPRGWIPPEQRAWRHPSETGTWSSSAASFGPALRTTAGARRTMWTTAVVGAGAVVALVTGGLMLVNKSPGPEMAATTSLTSLPTVSTGSIVRLAVSTRGASDYGCGVAVADGGLIATNASLLTGATRVMATTSGGRRVKASVIAIDPTSDVGLVRVGADVPVARFVDWNDVQPGTQALELAVATVPTGSPRSMWEDETIASIGQPVGSGPASGMVSVVATTPKGTRPDGAVLMERDGAILGLLDRSGVSAAGGGAVFLPGEFVSQVAQELMADDGQILHGWLGIKGSDSTGSGGKGALVSTVDAAGPSSGQLQPGDVIQSIDGRRVRTMADLKSRLYLLAPGARVSLQVERDGTRRTITLVLGTSP